MIQLLNQRQNANHAEFHVRMRKVQPVANSVMNDRTVFADQRLNSAKLEYDEMHNKQYLKGDSLKFQIEILKLDTV